MEEISILQFTLDSDSQLDWQKVRNLLAAEIAYEQMRAVRFRFVHLLAAIGLVVWLQSIWPDFVGTQVRHGVLALWASVFFVSLCAGIGEYLCHRKLKRCLAEKTINPSEHLS